MEIQQSTQQNWLDRPVFRALPQLSREKLILTLIILLALLSRFVGIGDRVMSHDEVNHVVPAYNFYQGTGYTHDPITHGPFQFHMLALSYFLFGDSDLSSRIPAALFSVAAIIFTLFAFRRYLGRVGAMIAGLLFLISPYILFYGRYTRNEAFIELFAVLTFYGFLRYYEKRDHFSLYLLAVVTALQFTTKEVAYIYTAQLLLFCGFLFLKDLWKMNWANRRQQTNSAMLALFTLLLFAVAMLFYLKASGTASESSPMTLPVPMLICGALGVISLILTIIYIVKALGWKKIRTSVSFNLIAFLGTLILPQLTAFPVKIIGWDPLDYSSAGILRTGIVLVIMFLVSFVLGCLWDRPVFLKSAAAFYIIFIFFYTTVFSNGQGFFTGIIGSLGYWLSQQGVQRGGQPGYYYWLIQVPLYEYGALLGTIFALIIAIKHRMFWTKPGETLTEPDEIIFLSNETKDEDDTVVEFVPLDENKQEILNEETEETEENTEDSPLTETIQEEVTDKKVPTLLFFLYWSLSSLIAYSIAGEKMPWLTVHIAMPLALSAAWGFGYLLERAPWKKMRSADGLISILLLVTVITSACGVIGAMLSPLPPFSGKTTEELKTTYRFALSLICLILSVGLLSRKWNTWRSNERGKLILICLFAPILILQARTAFTAAFINYDYANELLVYAHAAPGPKVALNMIEEIAARTGQGKSIKVAYDNDCLYPYWWYFRDYTSKNYFGDGNPTRELRNYDVIILNSSKDGRMEPIVKKDYYKYDYTRLWWPNQDYFGLNFEKVLSNLLDPQMRNALFHIWLDRDYSKYASLTNKSSLTPETWEPSARLSVYIRKDLMQRMWLLSDQTLLSDNSSAETEVDEEDRFSALDPVIAFGSKGSSDGQFMGPRGIALSPNGERVYVLDSDNNRVQYFNRKGQYEGQWNALEVNGMNQPWGIAVGTDGSVYIADTWNHRMLKFTAEGKFIDQWFAGDPEEPERGFYGPRSIAISSDGRVFVSDTGNKRVMVYNENGHFLYKFGLSGMGMGELDEPVGIALINDTMLAVADTWNQRVQVFDVSDAVKGSMVLNAFDVSAWYSQSLNNKPYLAASEDGTIYLTDPEGYLVMQYGPDGKLLRTWNGAGGDIDRFSMPTGITIDPTDGSIWITDAENCTVNQFELPALPDKTESNEVEEPKSDEADPADEVILNNENYQNITE